MEDIKKFIADKRPNLSKSSLTTYSSILKNLYSRVWGDGVADLKRFADETDKVLHFLKDVPPNRRKTILSSLVIITDAKPYRDLMLDDVRNYTKEISKQEKTDNQEASWISGTDIKTIYDDLKQNADLLYKKKSLTPPDLQHIQNYIIVSVLGGIFVPPRRSKDFVDFKIKNIDKTKDNFLDKSSLHFNSYKTAKCYGEQVVTIPTALKSILTKWIKIKPTDYLLFDSNMNQLSSVKLNQRLNKIFDKKVGVNQMRKTYLTDKYAKTSEENKKMEEDFSKMGSSVSQEKTYIKLN
jgi:hypothetical protein